MKILVILFLSLIFANCGKVSFQLNPSSNVSAIFLTCCDRHDLLAKTLRFFAEYNDYPLYSVIVVNDGRLTQSLTTALADTPDVTLINTGQKVGQIMAIDIAFSIVKTDYAYFSEDDMWLVEGGVIQMSV
jgi:hypothetical protein